MRFCTLREKEVINIIEGTSLGFLCDLVIDECTGKICSIVVPGTTGIKNFFQKKCYIIPWSSIVKIGDDVILVEVDLSICNTAT